MTTTRKLPDHGTLSRRKIHKCGCPRCLKRDSDYSKTRTRLQAYGRWQPFTDAEPVRAHVRNLMAAGLGIQTIARLSGVSSGGMTKLLYGERRRNLAPSKRVRRETADKLLAIRPTLALLADSARIDALGTRRRLQALVAAGWPQRTIAAASGLDGQLVHEAIRADSVEAATARAVCRVYLQLRYADPADYGAQLRFIDQAKRIATAEGWLGPGYWDDDELDDPDFVPATEDTPRFIALAEDGLELEQRQGYTRQQAADRLGVTKDYLQASITRYRNQLGEAA